MLKKIVCSAVLLTLCVLTGPAARAAGVVTNCSSDAQLQAAVTGGGLVTFSCSGTILLSGGLTITANTTIDGTGEQVALDGQNTYTVLAVNSGITLAVNNLTIQHGSLGIGNLSGGTVVVSNSLISSDTGPGLDNGSGVMTVTNTTIYGNTGAGILNNGTLAVTGSSLVANSQAITNAGAATVSSSILARSGGGNCNAPMADGGYNLSDDGTCGFTATGSANGATTLVLGSPQNNGGYTQTVAPEPGSAAISAIPPGSNGCATTLLTDQIGQMRPGNVNGNCSIGAYEYVSPVAATITDCANDSQLQAAAAEGGRIVFACSGTISLSQTVTLNSNTTVDGTGQSVTISAPGGNRIFTMNAGVVTLNHLTVANAYLSQISEGGAMTVDGVAILLNSTISNNVAFFGGAVYGGSLFLANDNFSNNGANAGGAIYTGGQVSITNCTFSGNHIFEAGQNGGAIYAGQNVVVSNSIFQSNSGSYYNSSYQTCSGNITDNGYNISDDGSCGFSQGSSQQNTSPNLGSLAYNGGSTSTFALNPGSPAIGLIPLGAGGCGTGLITDARGVLRPQAPTAGSPTCDGGAFQSTQNGTAITFGTSAPNLSYTVGTQSYTAQTILTLPFGTFAPVFAPSPQYVNGVVYTFANWSDGGAQSHVIFVGGTPAAYTANYTADLGSAPVCVAGETCSPITTTVTVNNSSPLNVNSVRAVTEGVPNLDFTAGNGCTGYLPPGQCSVNITFNPTALGLRMGAIEFLDGGGNVRLTTYISGIGQSPAVAYNSPVSSSIALNGIAAAAGLVFDAHQNLYIADGSGNQIVSYTPGTNTLTPITTGLGVAPSALALDGAGNLFFTVAGGAVYQIPAGGSSAALLPLNLGGASAQGIAVDGAGNLFVSAGQQVLKVPQGGTGQATSISGFQNATALALDALGNLYVLDAGAGAIFGMSTGSPQILIGNVSGATSLALDAAGDIYVAGSSQITEFRSGQSSPFVTFNAGGSFLAVDESGNLFLSNLSNALTELPQSQLPALNFGTASVAGFTFNNEQNLTVQNVGNQGLTINASYTTTQGVPVTADPNFFINKCTANPGGTCTMQVYFSPTQVGPLTFGTPVTDNVTFGAPPGQLSIPATGTGTGFLAAPGSTLSLTPTPVCASPQSEGCGETTALTFNFNEPGTTLAAPQVVTQGNAGLDFSLGSYNCTASSCTVNVKFTPLAPGLRSGAIQFLDTGGNIVSTQYISGVGQSPAIAFNPVSPTTLNLTGPQNPAGVAVDAQGNIYVADYRGRMVWKYAPGATAPTWSVTVNYPYAPVVDGAGNLFVACLGNEMVCEIRAAATTASPSAVTLFNDEVGDEITAIAVDGQGNLYASDCCDDQGVGVVEFPLNSALQRQLFGDSFPSALALDGAGDLFVADYNAGSIYEVPADRSQPTVTAASGLNGPFSLAVDAAGDLYVGTFSDQMLIELPAAGGTPVVLASGAYYRYLSVDASGNLFAAMDTGSSNFLRPSSSTTLVEFKRSQAPSLTFASTNVGSISSDSPQSVTIQNVGNQPLDAASPGLAVTGPNFVKVAGSGTPADCTSTFALTPGASCNLSISFAPQTAGNPLTSAAVFTDNALNASPSASQSIALAGTGTQTGTATVVTPNPASPIVSGQSESFTATVTPNPGTTGSTVNFTAGGISLSGCNAVPLTAGGTATCTTTALVASGSAYAIAAIYSGNSGYSGSTGNLTNGMTVNKDATTSTVTGCTPNPSTYLALVSCTATVVANASGSGAPTGSIAFQSPLGTNITGCSLSPLVSGSATCSTTTLPAGPDSVYAVYSGDGNFLTSTSVSYPQVVKASTVNVTVGTSPAGLAFTVDGTKYTSAQNFSWSIGAPHTIATTSPQTPVAGTEDTFANWSDSGALSHVVTATAGTTSYTASFNTSYLLTTGVSPSGGGTVTPASGSYYAAGTKVPLVAKPSAGYVFSSWTASPVAVASASSASTSVTMGAAAETVTANFISALTVSPSPSYSFGTVYLGSLTIENFTVSNIGTTPITVTGPLISLVQGGNSDEFVEVNLCPKSLAGGSHCTIGSEREFVRRRHFTRLSSCCEPQ
jgi:predicted outer membrane repeat protein